jgi:hypothetical protein
LGAQVCPILIARFKEREETVKIDIFSVFVDLLRHTNLAAARTSDADAARAPLRAAVPALMKGVAGQLKERSLKTKVKNTKITSSHPSPVVLLLGGAMHLAVFCRRGSPQPMGREGHVRLLSSR